MFSTVNGPAWVDIFRLSMPSVIAHARPPLPIRPVLDEVAALEAVTVDKHRLAERTATPVSIILEFAGPIAVALKEGWGCCSRWYDDGGARDGRSDVHKTEVVEAPAVVAEWFCF